MRPAQVCAILLMLSSLRIHSDGIALFLGLSAFLLLYLDTRGVTLDKRKAGQ